MSGFFPSNFSVKNFVTIENIQHLAGGFDDENANSFKINWYSDKKRDERLTLMQLRSSPNPNTFLIKNNLDDNLGSGCYYCHC